MVKIGQFIGTFASFLAMSFYPAFAQCARVADGCPTPHYSSSAHHFYIDPMRGSMQGDGSKSRPWHTFAEVISAGLIASQTRGPTRSNPAGTLSALYPNGVVRGGDILHLMSGDQGSVIISGYINPSFICVMADAGQTPVIAKMVINGSSNWDFEGLTFQSTGVPGKGKGGQLVRLGQSDFLGPVSNVFFRGNHFRSAVDVSNWTQQNWIDSGTSGLMLSGTNLSAVSNDLRNVRAGIIVPGTNVVVESNTIDNFGDDGIDFAGELITIRRNRITNSHVLGDGNHNDAMQGQVRFDHGQADLTPHHDILIDSNFVAAITDAHLPFLSDGVSGGMQGISEFDGVWQRLTIVNNVVLITAYHAITVCGARDSQIINNTVEEISLNPKLKAWIGVFNLKTTEGGTPSSNIIVRNNASPVFSLKAEGVAEDHNVCIVAGSSTDAGLLFADFKPQVKFDMRPKPGCALVGAGGPALAPPSDIIGTRRSASIDVGAYAFK
ncbi:MAG: hypothetical protein KGS72_17890 [Cyanobacteria bacterium REEB67]|nr:hypothetical protein [Cyanobacteria bacterium REEB67]